MALPPFFRRLRRAAKRLGLGSFVGGAGLAGRVGEPAPAGSGSGVGSGPGQAPCGAQRSKAS